MDDLKYIRVKSLNGTDQLLPFSFWAIHADVARGREVLSAGFIDLVARRCQGESTSLGLKADPARDTELLRALLAEPTLSYTRIATDSLADALLLFSHRFAFAEAIKGLPALSGGYADIKERLCYGRASSIQVEAHPKDTRILRAMLRDTLNAAAAA